MNVGSWHLAQVAPADLDIPILGQLTPAQLPLGDALEPGSLEIVGFDALLGGGAGTRAAAPRPHLVLADLDPELDGLPFGIPPGVPSWNVAPTDPLPIVRYYAKAGERSPRRYGHGA